MVVRISTEFIKVKPKKIHWDEKDNFIEAIIITLNVRIHVFHVILKQMCCKKHVH